MCQRREMRSGEQATTSRSSTATGTTHCCLCSSSIYQHFERVHISSRVAGVGILTNSDMFVHSTRIQLHTRSLTKRSICFVAPILHKCAISLCSAFWAENVPHAMQGYSSPPRSVIMLPFGRFVGRYYQHHLAHTLAP